MRELLDPGIEVFEAAPSCSEADVRATCRAFDFEPSPELIEFATELGGSGFGYNVLPGVEGQALAVVYTFVPDPAVDYSVLEALDQHDEPGVLPGYMPVADCNGNELWVRTRDEFLVLWEHESWKSEEELQPVAPSFRELVSGLAPS